MLSLRNTNSLPTTTTHPPTMPPKKAAKKAAPKKKVAVKKTIKKAAPKKAAPKKAGEYSTRTTRQPPANVHRHTLAPNRHTEPRASPRPRSAEEEGRHQEEDRAEEGHQEEAGYQEEGHQEEVDYASTRLTPNERGALASARTGGGFAQTAVSHQRVTYLFCRSFLDRHARTAPAAANEDTHAFTSLSRPRTPRG